MTRADCVQNIKQSEIFWTLTAIRGKNKTQKQKNETNKRWILSLFGSLELSNISWKKVTKADHPLLDRGIVKESRIADQRITTGIPAIFKHRSYRERISSSLSRNLRSLIKESSRNLCFYRQGISSSWSRNLSLLIKESSRNLGDRQAISSSLPRNLSLLIKESSRNLSLLLKESSRNLRDRQGISAYWSKNHPGISASIVKESPIAYRGISTCWSKNHRVISAY